jgi:uncharacterized protein YfaP (DUF2135 family)
MKLVRLALFGSLFFVAGAGCECGEVLGRLAPIVAIGDPFDPTFSVCTKGLAEDDGRPFRDCNFDFGEVDIGRARVFSFTIRNPSPVRLVVESVTLDDGSDPAFAIDGVVPEGVNSGVGNVGEVVSIKFAPTVEGPVNAVVRIKTDGENLDPDEDVVINLTAIGASRCQPDIDVVPAACDFGDVGVGATGFCDLTINNRGQCELVVSDLGFTAETAFPAVFGPQSAVNIPLTIPGGTGTSLRLYARPTSTDTLTGGLVIDSFDPDEPQVIVPLTVRGAQAPTCVARVSRINNTPSNDPSPAIEPLDDVELSADQSVASRQGGTIQAYEWAILDAPAESSSRLDTLNTRETRFVFDSATGRVRGVDVAGTFTVGLIVTDDLGARSTQCTIALNAVPRSGLHVQLTWDTSSNDIDLHLARNGTNWCSNDDCYYGGRNPNWGGGDANPSLDIDDLSGFGPENITIERPNDGNYTVGVDFYSGSVPCTTTIKIFIGGQLEYEGFRFMSSGQWLPARVDIRSGVATITELDSVAPQSGSCLGG